MNEIKKKHIFTRRLFKFLKKTHVENDHCKAHSKKVLEVIAQEKINDLNRDYDKQLKMVRESMALYCSQYCSQPKCYMGYEHSKYKGMSGIY